MRNQSYIEEARRCRDLAAEFVDRREAPFLLRAAETFDHLAGARPRRARLSETSVPKGLSVTELPASNTARWTPRRKVELLDAVSDGLLTLEEACDRYRLSLEEFNSWQQTINVAGLRGLRVTRLKDRRS